MSSLCVWRYSKKVLKNSRLHSVAEHKIYWENQRMKPESVPPKRDTGIKHSLGQVGE